MICNDFQSHLEDCVERKRPPQLDPFADHLAECPLCHERLADHSLLETALLHLDEGDESPDFVERVVREVLAGTRADRLSQAPMRASRGRRFARVAIAVVALGLLAVFAVPGILGLFTAPENPRALEQFTGIKPDPPRDDDGVERDDLRLDRLVAETSVAIGSLWNETGRTLGDLETLVPLGFRERRPSEEPGDDAEPGLAGHLRQELQPLGRQLTNSFGFLTLGR